MKADDALTSAPCAGLESAIVVQFSSFFEIRFGVASTGGGGGVAQVEKVADRLVERHKHGAMFFQQQFAKPEIFGDQIGDGKATRSE
jgi:hypothetical protein